MKRKADMTDSALSEPVCVLVLVDLGVSIGFVQVLAGVTQVSVSLCVIIFELTGGVSILLPIMVVILFAKMVTNYFATPSIYESCIYINRYPFLDVHMEAPSVAADGKEHFARDIMRTDLKVRTQLTHAQSGGNVFYQPPVYKNPSPSSFSVYSSFLLQFDSSLSSSIDNIRRHSPLTHVFFSEHLYECFLLQYIPSQIINCRGMLLRDLRRLIDEFEYAGFPVVDTLKGSKLVGYFSRTELKVRQSMHCTTILI